jgi:hypothetical protein
MDRDLLDLVSAQAVVQTRTDGGLQRVNIADRGDAAIGTMACWVADNA